jgi:Cu+-exporting ATPase
MEKVDTLVVDKTGTLTAGKPEVTLVEAAEGFTEAEVLRWAASVERASEHPLARAILKRAETLNVGDPIHVETVAGGGISGTVHGKRVKVGNARFLGIKSESTASVLVQVDGAYAGAITVADPVKETTPAALAALRDEGIRVVMLTGDNQAAAERVGRELGITEIEAGVLPDRKGAVIERLKSEGRVVAMAGDGINDAPALAAADVGIAMGTGTDIAIESAGVTLLHGDLTGIVKARKLSRATMGNIRQNLFFAFIYNAAGVPVAAGLLYPLFGVLLSPAIAAAAMALSSVSVIGNALRLRTLRLD